MRKPKPDFRIENHGSVVMVQPLTPAANDWAEQNVVLEDWQWFGGGFAVEPRYLDNLVDGILGDGLVVA